MSIVLDASMAMAWLFEDEETSGTETAFDAVTENGAIVPALWHLEIANVLRTAVRRNRCTAAFADSRLADLARLDIKTDPDMHIHAWGQTRDIARTEGLTIYDAVYLELALRIKRRLASCDADLVAAAKRRGVETLTS